MATKAPKANKGEKKPFKIVKKRSGRYSVRKTDGKYINGEEKVKILAEAGLVKLLKKKTADAAPAAEAAPQA